MTVPPVPVGAVIAGKYRVEKVLGAGAMGVVVAARHLELLELRAIKLMLPAGQESAENVERFLREARAAARLRSQHVAKVHDVGRLPDGAPYAVIEYLEGSDLKAVLDARGAIPPAEAVTYLLQVCEAISEAHAAGIVHRDLKPANLFLTRSPSGGPCVKVLDFGIAKMAAADGAPVEMTATSQMMGTPLYMSPEQMRGARDVDGRADIWALGVILYRMLTGRTPFSGTSVTEICAAVVADTPPAPRALRPELSAEMEAVILRCLQKNPAQRYGSVAELAAALAQAGGASASSVPAGGVPAASGGISLHGTMMMDPPGGGAPAARPQAGGGTFAGPAAMGPATMGPAGSPYGTPGAATMGPAASPYGTPGAAPGQPAWPGNTAMSGSGGAAAGYPPPGSGWGTASPAVSQGSWGAPSAAAPAPKGSRAGLFVGIGITCALGVGALAAVLVVSTGGDSQSSSSGGSGAAASSPVAAPPAAGSGTPAAAAASSGPRGRAATPSFGQGSSTPTGTTAPAAPAATSAAPAAAAPASAAPAGASPKSVAALQGVLIFCWKHNEGANKGEAASSATVQVTAGPSRSVLVSGPAKAKASFTSCVVSRAYSATLDPSDTVVVASASLPAGPT